MLSKRPFAVLLAILILSGLTGCSTDSQGRYVIGAPGFGNARLYEKPRPALGIKSRSDAISSYLSHQDLAPIEGVWVWDNNRYEVAIIRNNTEHYKEYDYLGVLTEWGCGHCGHLWEEFP
jgi:hypothetical protein